MFDGRPHSRVRVQRHYGKRPSKKSGFRDVMGGLGRSWRVHRLRRAAPGRRRRARRRRPARPPVSNFFFINVRCGQHVPAGGARHAPCHGDSSALSPCRTKKPGDPPFDSLKSTTGTWPQRKGAAAAWGKRYTLNPTRGDSPANLVKSNKVSMGTPQGRRRRVGHRDRAPERVSNPELPDFSTPRISHHLSDITMVICLYGYMGI